ncbi:MAG TPA: NERD domain-containing protein [Anaerolineales bacterium]|nr:NERD domain-containing protein [Anaerolineales bacterium]
MKIIIDEKLVRRNARIGQIATVASLVVLGSGMFLTFQKPELIGASITALLVGFLLSQVGVGYTNRWGRSPRPDEQLSKALKGLDKRYTLYHYHTPAAHLLVGPAGIWTIISKHQKGLIAYDEKKKRWKQSGGGFIQAYLKIFAQEGIGRPDLEIEADTDKLTKFLGKKLPDGVDIPQIRAALVFSSPEADVQADNAPVPTLPLKKLKDVIRREAKEKPIKMTTVQQIQRLLDPPERDDEA